MHSLDRLHTLRLPTLCNVCASPKGWQAVPERDAEWRFQIMCTVCLDDFLGAVPRMFRRLRARETTGRM